MHDLMLCNMMELTARSFIYLDVTFWLGLHWGVDLAWFAFMSLVSIVVDQCV